MDGIKLSYNKKSNVYFCLINSFSLEMKELLRKNLTSICEGEYDSSRLPEAYSYEKTLLIFLDRYNSKSEKIKKGMVGELLCHLLIPTYLDDLICVSPFFNLEERSIKKGHDLVYFDNKKNELWAVEVKSGELTSTDNTPNKKSKSLLSRAHRGIVQKLVGTEVNIWRNALKGVGTTLESGVTKNKVEKILTEYHDSGLSGNQEPITYNIVLSSSLFHETQSKTEIQTLVDWKNNKEIDKSFNQCIIFSLQKNTFSNVIEFLKIEAAKNKAEVA